MKNNARQRRCTHCKHALLFTKLKAFHYQTIIITGITLLVTPSVLANHRDHSSSVRLLENPASIALVHSAHKQMNEIIIGETGAILTEAEHDNFVWATGILATDDPQVSGKKYGFLAISPSTLAVTNHGLIDVKGTITGTDPSATLIVSGIYADAIGSEGPLTKLINTGTITARGTGSATSYALSRIAGVYFGQFNDDALFENHGTITATTSGTANAPYSVYIDDGTGTLSNAGTLIGGFYSGGSINVNNSGIIQATLGNTVTIAGDYTQVENGMVAIEAFDIDTYGTWQISGTLQGSTFFVDIKKGATLKTGDILNHIVSANQLEASYWTIISSNPDYTFDTILAIDSPSGWYTLSAEVTQSPLEGG